MMRGLSALPLDDDIVDRLLIFCPDFSTLLSTILASKSIYRVFDTHPKSITRAVAYNLVGPALPQALRVILYPYKDDQEDKYDASTIGQLCPESHDLSEIPNDQKKLLIEWSRVVATLENIYSLREKDRTCKENALTSEESWRFRRAMYRYMLYCRLFPANRYELEDIVEIQDDPSAVERIIRLRVAVLNEYPTDELLELHSVVGFLKDVLRHSEDEDHGDTLDRVVDVLLATGPAGVLQAWEERSFESLEDDIGFHIYDLDDDNPVFDGYFHVPFQKIWEARKVTPPKDDTPHSKWVLDTVIGANDTCQQCNAPGGLKLLTEANNWGRLLVNPVMSLKKSLKYNPTLRPALSTLTGDRMGPWISDVFAHRTAAFAGWSKGDSLCNDCLKKFIEEHLHLWLLAERLKTGWVPPEDCWYGYECRTQTHKLSHAQTKNHLCVPTRTG